MIRGILDKESQRDGQKDRRKRSAGPSGAVMNLFLRLSQGSRWTILATAPSLSASSFLVDWKNPVNAYFGFLYVPHAPGRGSRLPSRQIALIAFGCTASWPRPSTRSPSYPQRPGRRTSSSSSPLRGWVVLPRGDCQPQAGGREPPEGREGSGHAARGGGAARVSHTDEPAGHHRNGRERRGPPGERRGRLPFPRRRESFSAEHLRYIPALGLVPSAEQRSDLPHGDAMPRKTGQRRDIHGLRLLFHLQDRPRPAPGRPRGGHLGRTCGGARVRPGATHGPARAYSSAPSSTR